MVKNSFTIEGFRKLMKGFSLVNLLLLLVFSGLAGCSGDSDSSSGGSSVTTSSSTGSVSLSIKDAPLSSLRSLSIEVEKVTLKGSGNSDAQVFPNPQAGTSSTVRIDLLSLQGFDQLMANADVPTGAYHSVEVEFENPEATDTSGNAQVITVGNNTLTATFSPALTIAQGSTQSLQVDIDLQNSVIDLGGNEIYLSPAVSAQISTQALPVRRFPAVITDINTTDDRFEADIVFFGAAAPLGGVVTVRGNSTTTFNDGSGNITTGNITQELVLNDLVEIDGQLVGGVISADSVVRIPQTTPGGGLPAGGLPPVVNLSGTITDTDSNAGTITVLPDFVTGPAGAPSAFVEVDLDVVTSSKLHRRSTLLTVDDIVAGNFFHAYAVISGSSFEIADFDVHPAFVAGDVTNVASGSGANGGDLVTFTPTIVNQIPASEFAFLPASLDIEVDSGFSVGAGSLIEAFAFFDGTSLLKDLNFGGHVGALPPPPSAPRSQAHIAGEINASSTASVNGSGEIEFQLDLAIAGIAGAANPVTIDLVVDPAARIVHFDSTGKPETLSANDAVTLLNATPSPELIEAKGVADPDNARFNVTKKLVIFETQTSTLPPTNQSQILIGNVASGSNAELDAAGDIEFELEIGAFSGNLEDIKILVPQGAVLEEIDANGNVTLLTPALAVSALNNASSATSVIEVEGFKAASGTKTFQADLGLRILNFTAGTFSTQPSFFVAGTLLAASTPEFLSSGNLLFELEDYGSGEVLEVELDKNARMVHFDDAGNRRDITLSQVEKILLSDPFQVEVEGDASPTSINSATSPARRRSSVRSAATTGTASARFTANIVIRLFGNPSGPARGQQNAVNQLGGEVSATPTPALNNQGEIEFELEFFGVGGTPRDVLVKVGANASLESIDANGNFSTLSQNDAITALQADPDFVEVLGSGSYQGGSVFQADLGLRIFPSITGPGPLPGGVFISGEISSNSVAQVNSAGNIEFELDTINPRGQKVELDVIVNSSAVLELRDGSTGMVTTLTVNDAVNALNDDPSFIDLQSSLAPAGGDFLVDGVMTIFERFTGAGPTTNLLNGKPNQTTSASINAAGNLEFKLDTPSAAAGGLQSIDVSVTSNADVELVNGLNQLPLFLTLNAAKALLNDPQLNLLVDVEGSQPLSGTSFVADIRLTLFDTGSNPNGEILSGTRTPNSTVTKSAVGEVDFQLDIPNRTTPSTIMTVDVTVTSNAQLVLIENSGNTKSLTLDEAVDLLELNPPLIEVESLGNILSGTTFVADHALRVFEPARGGKGFIQGTVSQSTSPSINGQDLEFVLDTFNLPGTAGSFDVTVTPNADIFLIESGLVRSVGQSEALSALSANPFLVEAEGKNAATASSFVCDRALWIHDAGSQPAHILSGEVDQSTTATQSSSGGIEFDLIVFGNTASGGLLSVEIEVDQNATLELISTSGAPKTLTIQEAIDRLNQQSVMRPNVEVKGTKPLSGAVFEADIALRIFDFSITPGIHIYHGSLEQNTQASLSSAGEVELSLEIFDPFTGATLPNPVDVLVSNNALMQFFDNQGNQTLLSAQEAVDKMNLFPDSITIGGSAQLNGNSYFANEELTIFETFMSGGPHGLGGRVVSTAVEDQAGFIIFDLELPPTSGGAPAVVTVKVDPNGADLKIDRNGQTESVSVSDAVDELNKNPCGVEVEGSTPYNGGSDYLADQLLFIAARGSLPEHRSAGFVTDLTQASLGSQGEIEFSFDTVDINGGARTVIVTVPANTPLILEGSLGETPLTAQEAVDELNLDPNAVKIAGGIPLDTDTYTADEGLVICELPLPNNVIMGAVSGSATESNGELSFTIEITVATAVGLAVGDTVDVTVSSAALLQLNDLCLGGLTFLETLNTSEALSELNADPVEVQLAGSSPVSSGAYDADLGMIIRK